MANHFIGKFITGRNVSFGPLLCVEITVVNDDGTTTRKDTIWIFPSNAMDSDSRTLFNKLNKGSSREMPCTLKICGIITNETIHGGAIVQAMCKNSTSITVIDGLDKLNPKNIQKSVCRISSGEDYSHGFYVGNGWVMTNSHSLESVYEIEESSVYFSDDIPHKIVMAFSYRLSDEIGLPDLMLVKLSSDNWGYAVLSSLEQLRLPVNNNLVHIITKDNIYNASVVRLIVKLQYFNVYQLSCDDQECFQQGHSGSPGVFPCESSVCCVVFECRNGFGYAITWDSSFSLLSVVQQFVVACQCDGSQATTYLTDLVKGYNLQYYIEGFDQNEFVASEYSEYRIKFSSINEVFGWWKNSEPELCDDLICYGDCVAGTLPTFCIPFKRNKPFGKESHEYLVVHVHPREGTAAGNGIPSVNFSSANVAPVIDANEMAGLTPDEKSRKIFKKWKSLEEIASIKPSVTFKNNAWCANIKKPSVDPLIILNEMLKRKAIFDCVPELYSGSFSVFKV